jgi:N-acetylmuramoyl-L-alanine amidase CwlA
MPSTRQLSKESSSIQGATELMLKKKKSQYNLIWRPTNPRTVAITKQKQCNETWIPKMGTVKTG